MDARKTNRGGGRARLTGIALTVGVHVCALLLVSFSSLKYMYPPPAEQTFLIDFSDDVQIEDQYFGTTPTAENVDKESPVEITQRSESPYESEAPNLTPETEPDDFGDVPVPTPEPVEEKPVLDPRASFPGMARTDTTLTAAHAAEQATDRFKEGQSDGNTIRGRADGRPNAHVEGRKLLEGNIPLPEYNVQESGTVVVDIWVDNYGNVAKAVPGGDGTTVMDKALLAAARKAALETHFNQSNDAPAMQKGTITYYFNLK